jgi:hypothetical protein
VIAGFHAYHNAGAICALNSKLDGVRLARRFGLCLYQRRPAPKNQPNIAESTAPPTVVDHDEQQIAGD